MRPDLSAGSRQTQTTLIMNLNKKEQLYVLIVLKQLHEGSELLPQAFSHLAERNVCNQKEFWESASAKLKDEGARLADVLAGRFDDGVVEIIAAGEMHSARGLGIPAAIDYLCALGVSEPKRFAA